MERFAEHLIEQIPHLRRYARSLTRDVQQADDLVQDCLDRAWSRMSKWQADTNMRAWLFTIMHNLHVNSLRRSSHQRQREFIDSNNRQETAHSELDGAMELRDLENALARLPPDRREVLMLVCVEGLSYAQVSAVLGIPNGTVMSRLHRAREEIHQLMHGDGSPKLRRIK